MLTKATARKILYKYEEAWVEQDIDKIVSVFTRDGVYHEQVLQKPFRGHAEIARYWKEKVCQEQSNIKFKLLNYYISGNTLIAEWDASFNSSKEKARIHIREVAIMEIKSEKIKSLREYWQEEKFPLS